MLRWAPALSTALGDERDDRGSRARVAVRPSPGSSVSVPGRWESDVGEGDAERCDARAPAEIILPSVIRNEQVVTCDVDGRLPVGVEDGGLGLGRNGPEGD